LTDLISDDVTIRRAVPADGDGIADVWLAAWRVTYAFPPAHPDAAVRRWLIEELVPGRETWVAVDGHGTVVAMMALAEAEIDQLYVAPAWIGRGVGTRLVDVAKERRPGGLDLYTFQANLRARRFYEARGFVAVAWSDGTSADDRSVSTNEERQPDVRYAWRPG
jgi:ribosomal protein S18 acetylase RimI-like enzyme